MFVCVDVMCVYVVCSSVYVYISIVCCAHTVLLFQSKASSNVKPLTNSARKEISVATMSMNNSIASSGAAPTPPLTPGGTHVRLDVAENLETEIALLVTAGYTRDVAMKLVLQRINNEKAVANGVANANLAPVSIVFYCCC